MSYSFILNMRPRCYNMYCQNIFFYIFFVSFKIDVTFNLEEHKGKMGLIFSITLLQCMNTSIYHMSTSYKVDFF